MNMNFRSLIKAKPTKIFVLGVLVCFLIAFSLYAFMGSVRNQIKDKSVGNILEITEQGRNLIRERIRGEHAQLRLLSGLLRHYSYERAMRAVEHINDQEEERDAGRRYYLIKKGSAADEGVLTALREAGYPETGVVDPHINSITGTNVFDLYVRFVMKDGEEAYLVREYVTGKNTDNFSLSFYDNSGFSYIVNKNGQVLIRSPHKNANKTFQNIFDMINVPENAAADAALFRRALETDRIGWASFIWDGEGAVFCYVPVGEFSDWYVVSIIPESVVGRQGSNIVRATLALFGVILGVIILLTGVIFYTERRRGTMEIRYKEREYRDTLFTLLSENVDNVFMIYDASSGTMDYVFKNILPVFGINPEECSRDPLILSSIFKCGKISEAFERMRSGELKESFGDTGSYVHPVTGEERWVHVKIYRVSRKGFGDKYIICAEDQTDDRRMRKLLNDALEEAREANKAKSEFLSAMSHDIRTPMNGIIGMTAIAGAYAEDPEKVRDCLGKISVASGHLLNLINDILDISKIESGKVSFSEENFNLADVVNNVVTMIDPGIKNKNQALEIKVSDVSHEEITGDPVRLQQILTNLMSNAVKYTPEGGQIKLSIEELPSATAGYGCYRFIVEDNGIGMDEEFMSQIFQPFTRAKDSRLNNIQGSGLGMAITQSFIRMMGGTIEAESPGIDKGSRFTVVLNLLLREKDEAAVSELAGLRVLVIDDNEGDLENIGRMLNELGMECDTARSGEEGLRKAVEANRQGKNYFVVIADWKMPGMDGVETASLIKERVNPKPPVIVLSAYDWNEIEHVARRAGADAFISKPLFKSRLLFRLKKLLSQDKALDHDMKDRYAAIRPGDYSGKTILVVEDNKLNTEIVTEILTITGAAIKCAEDGKTAIDMFAASAENYYDLILMDVQMPRMNGYEATVAIRSMSRGDAATVPIVAMTANAFTEDIRLARKAGMNEYISKPIDLNKLRLILDKWLNGNN